MKILMVAPLRRRLGQDITASRSRIVYDLAIGLIKRGHSVSVLASGDSEVPGATIIPVIPYCLAKLGPTENRFYTETAVLTIQAQKIIELADQYDVVHTHTMPEFFNGFVADKISTPVVSTLHAPADPWYSAALACYPKVNFVALSQAHRDSFNVPAVQSVIPHGIDISVYSFQGQKEAYFLWIGRLSMARNEDGSFMDPKGVRSAIELAKRTGIHLKLSGSVEDKSFFDTEVAPHLSAKIEWVGSVQSEQPLSQQEVIRLMQGAKAYLTTNSKEEAFGLVAIEAMSCGTPVIGFGRGSVPEIVADGTTGFIVEPDPSTSSSRWQTTETGIDGLVRAVERVNALSEQQYEALTVAARHRAEQYFAIDTMVQSYETLYQQLYAAKQ